SNPAYNIATGLPSSSRTRGASLRGRPFFMAFLTISQATGRNRRQRFSLVSAVFGAGRFAADCHRLQPRGSIKAPYLRARIRVRSRGLMRFTLSNLKALIPSFLHCRWKGVVGVLRDASSAAQREGDPTFGRRQTVRAG